MSKKKQPPVVQAGPLADYKRLMAQLESAREQYGTSAAARQNAERDLNRATRRLEQLRKDLVAGTITEEDLTNGEYDKQQASDAVRMHHERECGALDATKAIEADIDQLLREHPAVFAEEAEQATQQANEALEYLWDSMRGAQEAWDAAVTAWAPLCRAHRVAGVAPFPLADPTGVLSSLRDGTAVPRPASVSV